MEESHIFNLHHFICIYVLICGYIGDGIVNRISYLIYIPIPVSIFSCVRLSHKMCARGVMLGMQPQMAEHRDSILKDEFKLVLMPRGQERLLGF